MMLFRAIPLLLMPLTGCMILTARTPDVPSTARPTLPPDQEMQVESDIVQETRNYKVTTGETCVKGTSDCVVSRENRSKRVNVAVAEASIDGAPLTIGQVAAVASPEYVKDTETLRGAVSACKRGKLIASVGWIAAIAAGYMLNKAYGEQETDPQMKIDRNLQIGGFAVLGAGAVGILGGSFLFGGQRCDDIKAIYNRWEPVYSDAGSSKVRGDSAEMLEKLVEKFNRDRALATPAPEEPPPTEPAEVE